MHSKAYEPILGTLGRKTNPSIHLVRPSVYPLIHPPEEIENPDVSAELARGLRAQTLATKKVSPSCYVGVDANGLSMIFFGCIVKLHFGHNHGEEREASDRPALDAV